MSQEIEDISIATVYGVWVLTYPYPPPSSSSGRPSRRVLPQSRHPFCRQTASSPPERRTSGPRQDFLLARLSFLLFIARARARACYLLLSSSLLVLADAPKCTSSSGQHANPRQERCPFEANLAKNNSGRVLPLRPLTPPFRPPLMPKPRDGVEETRSTPAKSPLSSRNRNTPK